MTFGVCFLSSTDQFIDHPVVASVCPQLWAAIALHGTSVPLHDVITLRLNSVSVTLLHILGREPLLQLSQLFWSISGKLGVLMHVMWLPFQRSPRG